MNRHASRVATPPRSMKMGASRAGGASGLYGVAHRSQSARAASPTDRCARTVHRTRPIEGADHRPSSAQNQQEKAGRTSGIRAGQPDHNAVKSTGSMQFVGDNMSIDRFCSAPRGLFSTARVAMRDPYPIAFTSTCLVPPFFPVVRTSNALGRDLIRADRVLCPKLRASKAGSSLRT